MPEKTGVLLLNIGSPESPEKSSVKTFLRAFLNDPRVVDIPPLRRWLLLNFIILPMRAGRSANAYRKIWTPEGSPLITNTKKLAKKLEKDLPGWLEVGWAMRYGKPGIAETLEKFRQRAVSKLIIFPLYPQYAASTTGSAAAAVFSALGGEWDISWKEIRIIPPFFNDPAYIRALGDHLKTFLNNTPWEHLLFSFHGLPLSHLAKSRAVAGDCLQPGYTCCETLGQGNRFCYRAHCIATMNNTAVHAGLPAEKFSLAFQSRAGRQEWLKPNTSDVLLELAGRGVKHLAVCCPSFVADCLETIEEIGMRARETFLSAGGKKLFLIPSLNDSAPWVQAAKALILKAANTAHPIENLNQD